MNLSRPLLIWLVPLLLAASPARQHYHWYPAAKNDRPRPWAVLFPRAMGIGALQPGNQYLEFARFLNARGIDALIIDDDRAAKLIKAKGGTGSKLATLANDAVMDARAQGRMDGRCPGVAVGWSRGGEGALALASSGSLVKAALVYYPSVRGQPKTWPQKLPVLALQGTRDSLAPHGDLAGLAAGRTPRNIAFEIKLYAGARHRFDVKTPTAKPEVSGPVENDYDAAASADALVQIDRFLSDNEITAAGCALD